MNKSEAYRILDAELAEYRNLGYSGLADLAGSRQSKEVHGAGGVLYRLDVEVAWTSEAGGDLKVSASIVDTNWFRFSSVESTLEVGVSPE